MGIGKTWRSPGCLGWWHLPLADHSSMLWNPPTWLDQQSNWWSVNWSLKQCWATCRPLCSVQLLVILLICRNHLIITRWCHRCRTRRQSWWKSPRPRSGTPPPRLWEWQCITFPCFLASLWLLLTCHQFQPRSRPLGRSWGSSGEGQAPRRC